ncbi:hypothetical protein [Aurantiacibacter suaedae]|uniref:hypothetical protein n=1 Tax=Aurantiacibacter suaedae TaxID=2545755 RepID=UPI0010F8B151|nr:hypothetical protein [Aurantiacibacter suaedae]
MRAVIILMVVLLSACENEPTFEERYSEAEQTISERAQAIESDLDDPAKPAPSATASEAR